MDEQEAAGIIRNIGRQLSGKDMVLTQSYVLEMSKTLKDLSGYLPR